MVCGHCLATLSLTINKTFKWLSSLPILMQESFWWWQCSNRYIISFFPHLHTHPPPAPNPFSPSLISLVVSVDVKHWLCLLSYWSVSACACKVYRSGVGSEGCWLVKVWMKSQVRGCLTYVLFMLAKKQCRLSPEIRHMCAQAAAQSTLLLQGHWGGWGGVDVCGPCTLVLTSSYY